MIGCPQDAGAGTETVDEIESEAGTSECPRRAEGGTEATGPADAAPASALHRLREAELRLLKAHGYDVTFYVGPSAA